MTIKNNLGTFPRKGSYHCKYCHSHKEWLEDFEEELGEEIDRLTQPRTSRCGRRVADKLKEILGKVK